MREIDFSYFNFEHGGLIGGHDHAYSSGRGYDFAGLIRVAGDRDRWAYILVLGEAGRYEMPGGEGMWEAAAAGCRRICRWPASCRGRACTRRSSSPTRRLRRLAGP